MHGDENAIRVDVFELPANKLVATYNSAALASRALFVRSVPAILRQVNSKFNKKHLKGIPSYKYPDKLYRFAKSKDQEPS